LKATSKTNPYDFKATQQSYGMWAVPPDIDTTVLVIFAKGENTNANAFWMGCVQDPMTNQMVPGNGSSTKTRLEAGPVTVQSKGAGVRHGCFTGRREESKHVRPR
jgi:hypothetical protein